MLKAMYVEWYGPPMLGWYGPAVHITRSNFYITWVGYFVAESYHLADAQLHIEEHLEQLEWRVPI